MKKKYFLTWLLFFTSFSFFAQVEDNALVLKIILSKYYKNEKVIAKGRLQLLSFYCKKAPNNEEVLELIKKNSIVKQNSAEVKKQIDHTIDEDWSKEFDIVFNNQNQYLKSKINNCLPLEEFQKISTRNGENNQRLLIVSKPIYFDSNTYALVKIAFYRNIEHNSGSYILFQKIDGQWIIKEYLNEWST